jgi:ATP-dependent DNA ligase
LPCSAVRFSCRMGLEGIVSKRVDAPYRSAGSRAVPLSKLRLAS